MKAALLEKSLNQPNFRLRIIHDQHFRHHVRTSTQVVPERIASPEPRVARNCAKVTSSQAPFLSDAYGKFAPGSAAAEQAVRRSFRLSLRFFLTRPHLRRER